MAPKVHAPVSDYTGTVAGVAFADGSGETESVAALAYFRRKGYTIDDDAPRESPVPAEAQAEIPVSADDPSAGTDESSGGDDPSDGDGDGDGDSGQADGDDPVGSPVADGKPERPHPVQGSAAAWFEYLTAIKPDHGFEVGAKRAELITAANAVDGNT